jgi:opacity protein-like surface antigen
MGHAQAGDLPKRDASICFSRRKAWNMKKLIAAAALLLVAPALVWAGNAGDSLQGQFYFFTAPIVSNTRYNVNPAYYGVVFTPGEPLPVNFYFTAVGGTNTGFGGEVLVHKGVGVGIELGYAGPDWSFDGNGAVGVGSLDASYHFFGNKSRRRVEPFLTGGYSLYYGQRTTTQSGFNLGGGVNLWVIKHVAPRLEVRYQGGINGFHGYSQFNHYVAFRFGMTFR